MLKILWKRGKIAPEEHYPQYLLPDVRFLCLKHGSEFLFKISGTEVEITRVDCSCKVVGNICSEQTL